MHGSGLNKRNYLYISDAVQGFWKILESGKVGEIYNIGSEVEKSNIEVFDHLLKSLEIEEQVPRLLEYVADRQYNDMKYSIQSLKLHKLGWVPKVSWEAGIEKTIMWHIENKSYHEK